MIPVVGFDFDECLAQGYTFVPFALFCETLLPRALKQTGVSSTTRVLLEKSRSAFYQRVAIGEAQSKGTLLRPSILKVLPNLLALRQQGKISNLFLYSNNGIKVLLEAVDHVLALTLMQAPYKVPENQFIRDTDGRLHCLAPRAHLDEPCRAVEPKEANGFREKSFQGISACLGMSLTTDQLWYLDDTRMHDGLMRAIGDKYVVVKAYNVKLANKKLAEMFIESFPPAAFQPNSREGAVILTALQTIMPGFRPTGRESPKSLAEKFTKELGKFSPLGGGRMLRNWTDAETATDALNIEAGLRGAVVADQVAPAEETAVAYRVAMSGGQRSRRAPSTSRRRMKRGERTRRKRAE